MYESYNKNQAVLPTEFLEYRLQKLNIDYRMNSKIVTGNIASLHSTLLSLGKLLIWNNAFFLLFCWI